MELPEVRRKILDLKQTLNRGYENSGVTEIWGRGLGKADP